VSRLEQLVEDHEAKIGAVMILVPIVTGWLPFLGLLNPLWSSLFGFPLHVVIWMLPHPVYASHPWQEAVAVLVWPFVLIAGLVWATGRILRAPSPWRERLIATWLIVSAFVIPTWFDAIPRWLFDLPLYVLD
jgi:hypothetical protein